MEEGTRMEEDGMSIRRQTKGVVGGGKYRETDGKMVRSE